MMMERAEGKTGRVDRVGRIIGGVLLVAGSGDIVYAGVGYETGDRYLGTLMALLAPASFVIGMGMWSKSSSGVETDEPLPPEPEQPSYTYQWVRDIGWVPLQPYDPGGPTESPELPRGDN
jgi:hypothetical protein